MSENVMTNGAVKALRKRFERDRDMAVRASVELVGRAKSDPAEDARLELALSEFDKAQARLAALPKIEIVREPDMYTPGGAHSFLRDLVAAGGQIAGGAVDSASARAADRLAQHGKYEQSRAELRSAGARAALDYHGFQVISNGVVQSRALSMVAGAAGEFSPPKFLDELFGSVARTASPLSRLVRRMDLPDACDAITVPRFTTFSGMLTQTSAQQTQGVGDDYGSTDEITANVFTIVGGGFVSQQWVDRVPLSDQILLSDFGEAYAATLEEALLTGSGTGGEPLGVLNVNGLNTVTYTATTPTTAGLVAAIGQAIGQSSDKRLKMPDAVLMRGSRLAWLTTTADGSGNEPTTRPGTGNIPQDPDNGAYGPIGPAPVYVANALPTNLGSGANQDPIVALRTRDVILLEDPVPRFTVYPVGGEAGQLSVYVGYHRYVAAVTSRYPSGISVVTGTGLAQPAGF